MSPCAILPPNEEYVKISEGCVDRVKEYCNNLDQWKLIKTSGKGQDLVEVFMKESDIPGTEDMYLLRTTYPTSVKALAALLYPWFPYRLQWDALLESAEIIKNFGDGNFIINHRTRGKYILNPRESVDAVKILQDGMNMFFASTSAPYGDVLLAPTKHYVRTTQYLGGYRLLQLDENRVEFSMLFHADLKLSVPRLMNNIVSGLKAKLMIEKADNLRKAIKNVPISPEHLSS
uniref:START domain-containing protein n=1 Tax=Steinernema glaseri TaxID=37863 RepID=A0A1I7YIH2_9BILA